ncbi:TIGR04104 family putative zinc finger protein [Lentibacillus kimchii]|uniref:TIGR04104 family putative zinc finger protein n=1 Tax=Lentibacillus kimchii TaxID=1542911 RepID=A0ABW2USR4_9BACI
MPTCANCHHRWSWGQTIKKTNAIDPAMTCPYCGEKQYETQKSRKKNSVLNLVILLPLLIQAFFDIPAVVLIAFIIIIFVAVILLHPLWMEISSREEPPLDL